MNNMFANLYEFIIRDPKFSNTLAQGQDYLWIGLSFSGITILGLLLFYWLIDPNPVSRLKWLLYLLLPTSLIAFVWSFFWLKTYGLPVEFANEEPGVLKFTLNIALYTGLFTLVSVTLLSFLVKRISINNYKNPF